MCSCLLAVVSSSRYQSLKKRMWTIWTRLQFRVCLCRDEVRMRWQFDELDEPAIGRQAGQRKSRILELLSVSIVYLPPMPVTFVDHLLLVELSCEAAFRELGRVDAKAHGPALVGHVLLRLHEIYHGIR